MLEINNLCVKKGAKKILDNISFSLYPGMHLCLVGPNGAGKTTLIRAIAEGRYDKGNILFDGGDAKNFSAKARARFVGVLSQSSYVNMPFSVREVVSLGRYSHTGSPPNENARRTDAALVTTGMYELRNRPVTKLSGGELRRVFLAQVLAQNPRVLILDEPVNDLDLKYQKMTFELTRKLINEEERCAITAVHDIALAKMYATHALILSEGSQYAFGEAAAVLCPKNLNPVYGMDVGGWLSALGSVCQFSS